MDQKDKSVDKPAGILRYNLFWDNTPFCTMLFVDCDYRKKGYGKRPMELFLIKNMQDHLED